VTGIGYLPQVATCGYENQALRAAKIHKIMLYKKNDILETKFDAVNTPASVYDDDCCYVLTKRHFALS
jgi:hypothetical protein